MECTSLIFLASISHEVPNIKQCEETHKWSLQSVSFGDFSCGLHHFKVSTSTDFCVFSGLCGHCHSVSLKCSHWQPHLYQQCVPVSSFWYPWQSRMHFLCLYICLLLTFHRKWPLYDAYPLLYSPESALYCVAHSLRFIIESIVLAFFSIIYYFV